MELRLELDDDLTAVFERVEDRLVDRSIRKGISDLANPIRQAMKAEAPKETGALRKAITKKSKTEHDTALVYVGVNYRKSAIDVYQRALFQEHGTRYMDAQPFIEPVALRFDDVQHDVRELIESRLQELAHD